jgi:hypothetical protein
VGLNIGNVAGRDALGGTARSYAGASGVVSLSGIVLLPLRMLFIRTRMNRPILFVIVATLIFGDLSFAAAIYENRAPRITSNISDGTRNINTRRRMLFDFAVALFIFRFPGVSKPTHSANA